MAPNQGDEVGLRVAAQRRGAEVRVAGQEAIGRHVEVGEVAASPARDQDLCSHLVRMLEQDDLATTLPRRQRTHQPGGARSQDNGVEGFLGCDHGPLASAPSAAEISARFWPLVSRLMRNSSLSAADRDAHRTS